MPALQPTLIILYVPVFALLHYLVVEQGARSTTLPAHPNLLENAKEPKTVAFSVLLV